MTWTDDSAFLSLTDDQLLAITAWAEARGEGGEGQMGVLSVIINRTTIPFLHADSGILAQGFSVFKAVALKQSSGGVHQFSCFNSNDAQRSVLLEIAQNFDFYLNVKPYLSNCLSLAQLAIMGNLGDNTGGATHYVNLNSARPSWYSLSKVTTTIGNHTFLALNTVNQYIAAIVDVFPPDIAPYLTNPLTWVILAGVGYAGYNLIYKRRK